LLLACQVASGQNAIDGFSGSVLLKSQFGDFFYQFGGALLKIFWR